MAGGLAGELTRAPRRPFGTRTTVAAVRARATTGTARRAPHAGGDGGAAWRALRDSVESKRRASLELLGRGGWDLYMAVMGETHCVGHQFWHLHDATTAPRPRAGGRLGDPLVTSTAGSTRFVGDHLAALGPDDTAYVTLAHGMTAAPRRHAPARPRARPARLGARRTAATAPATRAARAAPAALRGPLVRRLRDRFGSGRAARARPPRASAALVPGPQQHRRRRRAAEPRRPRAAGRIRPADRRAVARLARRAPRGARQPRDRRPRGAPSA